MVLPFSRSNGYLRSSRLGASNLWAPFLREPEVRAVNRMLTPISSDMCPPPVTTSPSLWASYRHTTCQPRGSHQADIPRAVQALATRKLGNFTVEIDSPQPPRPRYAIWRGGLDSMVAPTSCYSGLHNSKGLVFHLQTHEPLIRNALRCQIP
jgi:hypothetical protein